MSINSKSRRAAKRRRTVVQKKAIEPVIATNALSMVARGRKTVNGCSVLMTPTKPLGHNHSFLDDPNFSIYDENYHKSISELIFLQFALAGGQNLILDVFNDCLLDKSLCLVMDFTDRVVVKTCVFSKQADCFTEQGKKMMNELSSFVPIHFFYDEKNNGMCFFFDENLNAK